MLLLAAGGSSKTEIRALQGQEVLDYTNKVVKDRSITAAQVKEVYEKYAREATAATTKSDRLAWIIHRVRVDVA